MTSDSDSDSLPSLEDLLPKPSNEIHPGDIVWAKFRKLYWPALVRRIYKKEKKMTIWYTDEPGKCFKLPFRKICSFHDTVMTNKIKKDAEEAGVIAAHDGLASHAISYLNRKAEGYNDDPMKFFDQTYPFFLMEKWLKNDPGAANNTAQDLKISPLYISHKPSTPVISRKTILTLNSASSDVSSDVESVSSNKDSDAEVNDSNVIGKEKKKTSNDFKSNLNDSNVIGKEKKKTSNDFKSNLNDSNVIGKEKKKTSNHFKSNLNDSNVIGKEKKKTSNDFKSNYAYKIVDYIKSKKADKYLEEICSRKICSDYEKFYEISIHTNKVNFQSIAYGPMDDDDDMHPMRELIAYLLDLYDNMHDGNEKNTFEKSNYVSYVLLPESIIFAISKVNEVSLLEAKDIFRKYNPYSKPIEILLSQANSGIQISEDIATVDTSLIASGNIAHENCNKKLKNGLHEIQVAESLPLKECIVIIHDCKSEIEKYSRDLDLDTKVTDGSSKEPRRMIKKRNKYVSKTSNINMPKKHPIKKRSRRK